MNSNFLAILLLGFILWSSERYSASAYVRRISKPSKYLWNEKIRSRVPNEAPVRQYTECGGPITKGPGTIEQYFVSRNYARNVRCTWKIRAPENHHVYVKQLRLTRTTLQNADAQNFNDAPKVQVFDGAVVDEGKRLFKSGDSTLNQCLSSGQELTVELRYDEMGKHIDQEAVIKYGFIESSEVEDLIP